MSQLKRIHLTLARTKDHPHGSRLHGYDFIAPLTAEGHIDAQVWKQERSQCRVRRFWQGEADQQGLLVHGPGGSWAFVYDFDKDGTIDDTEQGYRFQNHVFQVGEYVSLREEDGEMITFQVQSVESV